MKLLQARRLELRINTQEWFDGEIAELIMLVKKLLKFKNSKLHIDEEKYKEIKYQVQTLIRKMKREFYETNLRQKINKSKELIFTKSKIASYYDNNVASKDLNF